MNNSDLVLHAVGDSEKVESYQFINVKCFLESRIKAAQMRRGLGFGRREFTLKSQC